MDIRRQRRRRAVDGRPTVAFVGPLPPTRGGIAQHSARLVEALARAADRVVVRSWAAQYPARLYPGEQVDPSAALHPLARPTLRWWDPSSWWRAGRAARGAEVLVVPWVTPLQAVPLLVVFAAARGTARVAVVHNPLPHERRLADRWLSGMVLRRLDGAVVHASSVAAQVRALAPEVAVEVVPHPPNLALEPRPLPPTGSRALFLGFVRPYKGVDVALDAVRLLADRGVDVELTIAGTPWDGPGRWQDEVVRRDLSGRVHLDLRYVPDAEVGELLGRHHLVVLPYRSATQSGVVALAHAAGRPVVASRTGGLVESVRDGVDGVLVAPDDAGALADGIEQALAHLGELATGAAGASTSWDDVADAVLRAGDRTPAEPEEVAGGIG